MLTAVKANLKYIPTFQSDDLVVLNTDCERYTMSPEFVNKFFKKGRICIVQECGLSHFVVDNSYPPKEFGEVENCEWCLVDAIIEEEEHKFFDEEGLLGGTVRAKDLREWTVDDMDNHTFL